MKTRPIVFRAFEARQLFHYRKTQHRFLVKCPEEFPCLTGDCPHETQAECDAFMKRQCPQGKVGEFLWVREPFAMVMNTPEPWARKKRWDGTLKRIFQATPPRQDGLARWKPQMFLAQEHARTYLKVVDIRCERLHSITRRDAIAEGVVGFLPASENANPRQDFAAYWCSIHSPGSWKMNPWVFVLEFIRVPKPVVKPKEWTGEPPVVEQKEQA